MPYYPLDVRYAFGQLGLEANAAHADIHTLVPNALACRFAAPSRINHLRRFTDFLAQRESFGVLQAAFTDIKRAYHRLAMDLHPDRNGNNAASQERLKTINLAYGLIESVNREAKIYFDQPAAVRRDIEYKARQETARERTAAGPQAQPRFHAAPPAMPCRYAAASIPRYIRQSRLFYLPTHTIIGSRSVKTSGGGRLVYDIVMLPERDFMRARFHLGMESGGAPELRLTKLTPAYVPMDLKLVQVPPQEKNPFYYARSHFVDLFGLTAAA